MEVFPIAIVAFVVVVVVVLCVHLNVCNYVIDSVCWYVHYRTNRLIQSRRPRRIILLRHAESCGNEDKGIYAHVADNKIELTSRGVQQAKAAGKKLKSLLGDESILFYVSPFRRSQQTFEIIAREFDTKKYRAREDPRIREQEWGNFQNPDIKDAIMAEREKVGRFFYRFNDGESGADVFDRVSSFMESLFREMNNESVVENIVIVSHGLFMRLFLMRFYRWSVERFHSLWNFENAEFAVLEKDEKFGSYQLITKLRVSPHDIPTHTIVTGGEGSGSNNQNDTREETNDHNDNTVNDDNTNNDNNNDNGDTPDENANEIDNTRSGDTEICDDNEPLIDDIPHDEDVREDVGRTSIRLATESRRQSTELSSPVPLRHPTISTSQSQTNSPNRSSRTSGDHNNVTHLSRSHSSSLSSSTSHSHNNNFRMLIDPPHSPPMQSSITTTTSQTYMLLTTTSPPRSPPSLTSPNGSRHHAPRPSSIESMTIKHYSHGVSEVTATDLSDYGESDAFTPNLGPRTTSGTTMSSSSSWSPFTAFTSPTSSQSKSSKLTNLSPIKGHRITSSAHTVEHSSNSPSPSPSQRRGNSLHIHKTQNANNNNYTFTNDTKGTTHKPRSATSVDQFDVNGQFIPPSPLSPNSHKQRSNTAIGDASPFDFVTNANTGIRNRMSKSGENNGDNNTHND